MENDLEYALQNLNNGSAICFIGAGFSIGAKDRFGKPVPSSVSLEKEICDLIGIPIEEGGTLSDLADYCATDPELALDLKNLFLDRLTKCKPTNEQKLILNSPWRSIFTTNFDDIPETSIHKDNLQLITPNDMEIRVNTKRTPVFYLHGRARDIEEKKSDPLLVVSETNYLDIKHNNKELYAHFINEMTCAQSVFFIGYSLRDMEIARRIFSISEDIQSKSIVICYEKESHIQIKRLEKFGQVFPIGQKGLSEKIENIDNSSPQFSDTPIRYIEKFNSLKSAVEISTKDIDRLVLAGNFNHSCYALQENNANDEDLYCVDRKEKIDVIFEQITKNINRFSVESDIGNGKSIFLEQLKVHAFKRGYKVYTIDSRLPEIFQELDILLDRNDRQFFIIDDLIRYQSVVKYIGKRLPATSILICTTRSTHEDTQHLKVSSFMGGASREIDLNQLSQTEIDQWDLILERYGYWQEKIASSESSRKSFLKTKCNSENRSIVLSLFKSSLLSNKIDNMVDFFIKNHPEHTRPFITILINALCHDHVDWSSLVQWLKIDEQKFRSNIVNSPIFNFLAGRRDWHQFTSPQLASYIFKTYDFDEVEIVNIYTNIVRNTAYASKDKRSGSSANENIKELMKYSFLIDLLGDSKKSLNSIESVYKSLSSVSIIRRKDQFWLQYAMSNMALGNLVEAETYINTALGIATKKGRDYSPVQIIDQMIRLLFEKNAQSTYQTNQEEIEKALSNLNINIDKATPKTIIYALRSVPHILNLLEAKDDIAEQNLENISETLDRLETFLKAKKIYKAMTREKEALKDAIFTAKLIVKSA